jgi:D-glucuronyl C5-epimerase C-terminus
MKGSRRTVAVVWGPIFLSVMTASLAAPAPAAGAAADEAAPPAMRAAEMSLSAVEPVTTPPAALAPSWRVTPYAILPISPARRYEVRQGGLTTAWPPTRIHDSYGVPMRIYDGVKRYHPVGLTRMGLAYLRNYRLTHDARYLDRAKRIAGGLKRMAVSARGALWFPYRFRWTMHGVDRYLNRPPWYSGMAQGLALALFSRLYQYTRDASYLRLADLTYASLRNMGRGTNPWVSWIDGRHYLWIEEYPQQLDQTFNGFVFAIIGLHDYSQLTKDPALYSATRDSDVLALLRGGITTIRAYTPTFRNPGAVSDYCLAHHYRNPKYHPVHIAQLRYLTLITGDPWFGRMADAFAADVR